MEGNEKIANKQNGLSKNIVLNICHIHNNIIDYQKNYTVLDLSNRDISSFSDDIELPTNLTNLKLANNKLKEIPHAVMNLCKLKVLDLSHNMIINFDDLPCFHNTIEVLNLSHNKLEGPPLWVWLNQPLNLVQLNLSNNIDLHKSLSNGYFEYLLEFKTQVTDIDVHNCKLSSKHLKLLSTFCNAKVLNIGSEDFSINKVNHIVSVPCPGLDQCCDIERLNACNTYIYTIEKTIDMYKNLIEINLSQNDLRGLPDEFCNLHNLQICILSCNKILYLPDDMGRLKKLSRLHLDFNELCMLPDTLRELPDLVTLDLYNNHLCDEIGWAEKLQGFDCAQNYFEEPSNDEYLVKKEKIRANCQTERMDGRQEEQVHDERESDHWNTDSDDEELIQLVQSGYQQTGTPLAETNSCSTSPEDWDSDSHWIPQYTKRVTPPRSPWVLFVKKKMEQGNFCPMDAHPIPVADKLQYERQLNPTLVYESDGQFDDYSDDNT